MLSNVGVLLVSSAAVSSSSTDCPFVWLAHKSSVGQIELAREQRASFGGFQKERIFC